MKNWTYVLKDLPKPRCQHQVIYHKAFLYAFGGKLINDTRPPTGTGYKLDLSSNTWSVVNSEMKTPRFNFASCVLGDKIYAIGGMTKDNTLSNMIEEFDVNTKTWVKSPIVLTEKSSNGYAFPWDETTICYIGLGPRKKSTFVY
jgi:hypothetical protein